MVEYVALVMSALSLAVSWRLLHIAKRTADVAVASLDAGRSSHERQVRAYPIIQQVQAYWNYKPRAEGGDGTSLQLTVRPDLFVDLTVINSGATPAYDVILIGRAERYAADGNFLNSSAERLSVSGPTRCGMLAGGREATRRIVISCDEDLKQDHHAGNEIALGISVNYTDVFDKKRVTVQQRIFDWRSIDNSPSNVRFR
ncbi:hypothetical protein [Aurantimonas sp. 22II-16-19i]|uniref:hypothetical protein n=1 Tax=Aurantimonas sp. 22II-16-19i TaxID=1317114 RepID=UPI00111BED08|nr:hypothetical protein [Aurantimonas sp. 22II-16-19i]